MHGIIYIIENKQEYLKYRMTEERPLTMNTYIAMWLNYIWQNNL